MLCVASTSHASIFVEGSWPWVTVGEETLGRRSDQVVGGVASKEERPMVFRFYVELHAHTFTKPVRFAETKKPT